MNYSTQPGISYLSIGPNGVSIAGVFLHPERVQILRVNFEGEREEGYRYYPIPDDKTQGG